MCFYVLSFRTWSLRRGRDRDPLAPANVLLLASAFWCPDDDVDLEALMSDMNSSLESLYPGCNMDSETAPLRPNGQHSRSPPPASGSKASQPQASLKQKVQRSQPVHILAARWDEGLRVSGVAPGTHRGTPSFSVSPGSTQEDLVPCSV